MLIWTAMRQDVERLAHSAVGTILELQEVPCANLGGVFWLNAGLALENLFKGIIVRYEPNCIVNGIITKSLRTHDLLELAKRAGFASNGLDAFFLRVGTECVKWAGRYPCSTKPGESAPPVFSESDVIAYRSLFDRLADRFESKTVTLTRLA